MLRDSLHSLTRWDHEMVKLNRNNHIKKAIDVDKTISKKKQQALNTKTTILETAIQLIKAHGYPNVTVNEICEKSGVTKGAFYHHFDSKQSLLGSLYLDSDYRVIKNIPQIMKKSSSLEQTADILLIYAEMIQYKGVEFMKQIIRNNLDSPTADDIYNPQRRPAIQLQLEILKTGQMDGEIRKDVTPEYILWYIISSLNGILLDWCYQNGSYDYKEKMGEALTNMFVIFKTENIQQG